MDCGRCKNTIESSIEKSSTAYGIDFESTIIAAKEAIVKKPTRLEAHGTHRDANVARRK